MPSVDGGGRDQKIKAAFDRGHNFHTDILCCPKCGEVFLPEPLVTGRMAEVERELEDK